MKPSSSLSNDQKLKICHHKAANQSIKQSALANWAMQEFKLSKVPTQGTISNILAKHQQYESMDSTELTSKRQRAVKHPELDNVLANWVLQCQARQVALSGDLIKEKARQFSRQLELGERTPEFSNGWLAKFNIRHGFKAQKSYGESGSVDLDAIDRNMPTIKEKLQSYSLQDIYNMDETGLFYRMAPDRTIARRQIEGSKKDKTRLTFVFAANADGSHKMEPLIIGHAQRPRAFNRKSGEQLGFYYRSNAKAWMTGLIFREWLQKMDQQMQDANRKVLLLLDNAPSHVVRDLPLTNVQVFLFPANTTSKIQPMDAGIIATFKRRYRRFQLQNAIDRDEQQKADIYKVDQLIAMKWAKAAWNDISSKTIANFFKHTGLFERETQKNEVGSEEQDIENELEDAINQLPISRPMSVHELINPEEEQQVAHEEISDEDLIKLSSSQDQEEEEDGEVMDENPPMSTKEKLNVLHSCISFLDLSNPNHVIAHKVLRNIQFEIRTIEKKQTTLDRYFCKEY